MMRTNNQLKTALLLISVSVAILATAQTKYWVGGSGQWSDAAHWSASLNGAGGAGVPHAQDNVQITSGSNITVNIANTAWCADLVINASRARVRLEGGTHSVVNISGGWKLIGDVQWAQRGTVLLTKRHGGVELDLRGSPIAAKVICDQSGSWSMLSDLVIDGKDVVLKNGTLITNGNMLRAAGLVPGDRGSGHLIASEGVIKLDRIPDVDLLSSVVEHANSTLVVNNQLIPWGTVANDAQRDINVCGTGVGQTPFTINATLTSNYNGFGVRCRGQCNATVTVTRTGGIGPFTYQWLNGGPPTATWTMACGGPQLVLVTDVGQGITCATQVNVTEPPPLGVLFFGQGTPPTCAGVCNGSRTAFAVGGVPGPTGYSYNWNNGAGNQASFNQLCAGANTLRVTDLNACFFDTTFVFNLLPITPNFTKTDATCFGNCNGTAQVAPTGGTGTITYDWGPGTPTGDGTQSVTGLCAGNYFVTLTDANGCDTTRNFTIIQPPGITPGLTTFPASCFGICDGAASVAPGAGTFTYLWSPAPGAGQNTVNASLLCAIPYTVTIRNTVSNCDTTVSFTITSPPAIDGQGVAVDATCAGVCDGSITLSAIGGSGSFTYAWAAPLTSTASSVSNLCAGNYSVTITDNSGCDTTLTFTIDQPLLLEAVLTTTDVSCAGACDGTANVAVTGGSGGYTYLWSPSVTGQGTANATGLCAPAYSVLIRDVNGCDTTINFTINVPAPLTATQSQTNVTCGTQCDGTAGVVVSGGTVPYTYLWTPNVTGQGAPNATGLCAGPYSLLITDANGCELTISFTILPASPITLSLQVTPVSCPGICDGTSGVIVGGGMPGYQYLWTPAPTGTGQGTPNVTGLCAIAYTLTVTDLAGCDTTIAFTVPAPVPINVTSAVNEITCNGACDGRIVLTSTGGNGTFAYAWTPSTITGNGTNSVSQLCAGNYAVVVSSGGCDTTLAFMLAEPAAIVATLASTNLACPGVCDGNATVSATGGSGTLTYTWAPGTIIGQNTQTATGLCGGNYTVTVADPAGCDTVIAFTIIQAQPLVSALDLTPTDCGGVCSGTATVTVPAAIGPVTYLWGPGTIAGQGTANATGLCTGPHTLTVSSASGCDTTVQFLISTPSGIMATPTTTDVSCGNVCDGTINVVATGGTGQLTYTWAPPIAGQNTPNVSQLCRGTYSLTISDAAACDTTLIIVVGGADPVDPQLTHSNETCYNGPNDGTLTVDPIGGSGVLTIFWSPPPNAGQGTTQATGLYPGVWCVTITDAAGCDTTVCDTILPMPILGIGVDVTAGSCANECGGEATITNTGGYDPFLYLWTPQPTIGYDSTETGTGLCAGAYSVFVRDAAGCDTTITFNITTAPPILDGLDINPETCNAPCSGSATVSPSGGIGMITANWQPDGGITGQGTYSVTGLCAGTAYTVTLTDSTGCDTTVTFNVDPFTDIAANITSSPATCADTCDATATAGPTGGTLPYTYSWSPEPGGGQGTSMATGLCPGSYDLLITDSLGCPHTESVLILAPDPIVDNAVITPISCGGVCDGAIALSPTGGNGSYIYLWSPSVTGQGTSTATNLCVGMYSVTVSDGVGCDTTFTYDLTEPTPVVLSATSTESECNVCIGTATVQISGGTPGYMITWTNANNVVVGNSPTVIDLCAGLYIVMVTDTNGCSTQMVVPVSDSDGEDLTTSNGATVCPNVCDGSVSVAYNCSDPSCSIAWFNAMGTDLNQSSDTATGLCVGTYYVQVTNASGCISIDTAMVVAPLGITVNISSSPVTCNGDCDGTATIGVSGVQGPFAFNWGPGQINGQGTPMAIDLCPGSYTVNVTYGGGCDTTVSVLILEPALLTNSTIVTDVSCNGNCNGTITLSPQGGNGGFSFTWLSPLPNGQTGSAVTDLCPGDYIVSISDVNGCSLVDTITVAEPAMLVLSVTTTESTCPICDGTASATVSGGTLPYSFSWMLGGNEISTDQNPMDICAGLYNLIVTDSSGCTAQRLVPIQDANGETLTTTDGQTNCANDCDGAVSVDFVCSALDCITVWYNALGDSIGNTTAVTGLCQGTYDVVVMNGNGCISIDSAMVVPSTTLVVNLSSSSPSCPGVCDAIATVGVTGGFDPYTYLWNDPMAQTTSQATGLCAGSYNVSITDSTGCDTLISVLIIDPQPIMINGVASDANCNGVCDGSIITAVTGGAGQYTYTWTPAPPNGQGNSDALMLCPGMFSLTVTDANGCTATESWTIDEPTPITLSATSVQSECGICNGSAEVFATGGTPDYTYIWTLGAVIYGTDSVLNNVCAGLYTVVVTDMSGCQTALLVPVTDIDGEVINAMGDTTSCANVCDGTVTVDFVCSDPQCTIAWFDAAGNDLNENGNTVDSLCAGTYFVQVTNATGCISLDTAIVTAPPDVVPNLSTTQPSCPGACDGMALVAPTGGSGAYSFLWTPAVIGQGTAQADSLCAGQYNVLITDTILGCSSMFGALIIDPVPVTATIIAIDPTCNGACDGSILVVPQGGAGSYTYQWNPSPTPPDTNNLTGLCAGTWSVLITDANGCDTTYSITLNDPPVLEGQLAVINNSCSGDCVGSATATITGGVMPYQLIWTDSNGSIVAQDTVSINSLCNGSYLLMVTDSGGCELILPFNILGNSSIEPNLVSTNETCTGPCDGTATVQPTGGLAPFTYIWAPGAITGQGTNAVSQLCAGGYSVLITDSVGCDTMLSFTIDPYAPIDPSAVQQDILCNGECNGSVILSPTGGTGVYTYAWSLPNGPVPNEATNLCPGVISVTIDDGSACDTTLVFSIAEPSVLTVTIDLVVDASCLTVTDGSIDATVVGGTGTPVINWQGPNNFTSALEDIANLAPGSYIVTVTDANACSATTSATVNALSSVQADAGADITFCSGTSTILDGSASTGAMAYAWTDDQNLNVGNTAVVDLGNLPSGVHVFTLTVSDGPCTSSDQVAVTVQQIPIANAGPDHSIFISGAAILGGSPTGPSGSTFLWEPDSVLSSNSASNPTADPNTTQWFTVTVTGPNGCVAVDSVLVTVLPDVVFPTGFTPNGDGYNDTWVIDFVDKFPQMEVEVYNRWGEMLFRSVGYNTPWDGKYSGGVVPVGTYYYVINLNDPMFPNAYTGPLTVIR